MVRLATLGIISGGLGIGIISAVSLLRRQTETFANQAAFIMTAINIMKDQPAVRNLMGDSIQHGRASFMDGWSKIEELQVKVMLPVKGEKDEGSMFAYARKKHKNDKFRLFKIEMTFDKIKGKKLVLLDLDSDDPLDEILKPKVTKDQSSDKNTSDESNK